MSHVFSTPPSGQGSQLISADEAKQLIRGHQNRDSELNSSVTVQAMAETLGLPVWQVEQMVQDLRSQPSVKGDPIPANEWLKKQLWKWVIAAVVVMSLFPIISQAWNLASRGWFKPRPRIDRYYTDGIYNHGTIMKGRALGMKAPAGFSFEIKYGDLDAAINGHSLNYNDPDDLSAKNLALLQEEYANDIIDGLDKAIKADPPDWTNGESPAVVTPNYYPGGFADPFNLTLQKSAFPYDPNSPVGKQLHDEVLQDVKDHWSDIT